jgi:hypothetical protein
MSCLATEAPSWPACPAPSGNADGAIDFTEADSRKRINEWNKSPRPFVWTRTADEIPETTVAYFELLTTRLSATPTRMPKYGEM